MGAERPLRRDDLDELSEASYEAAEPDGVAAELVAAADSGRLADSADAGYAYLLAAEIHERIDALARALALAERAVAAHRAVDDRDLGRARAFRAGLLLRLGRDREAMVELAALRPLLTTDPPAASYLAEALSAGGRTDIAVEWLSGTLAELSGAGTDPVRAQLATALDRLADTPLDDLSGEVGAGIDLDEGDDSAEAVLLVWPEPEYEKLDERWPEVLEATGADDWDDYRRRHQALITTWGRYHRGPLWQVTGTVDGFEEFLAAEGVDLASADLVSYAERYGDQLAEQTDPQPLPPEDGDPCWCRSGFAYERCCRRLASR